MRHQLDIIHDDEALKMGQQTIILVGSYLQFKLVFFAPNRQVALDPALRVEHHVPCAGPRDQIRTRCSLPSRSANGSDLRRARLFAASNQDHGLRLPEPVPLFPPLTRQTPVESMCPILRKPRRLCRGRQQCGKWVGGAETAVFASVIGECFHCLTLISCGNFAPDCILIIALVLDADTEVQEAASARSGNERAARNPLLWP